MGVEIGTRNIAPRFALNAIKDVLKMGASFQFLLDRSNASVLCGSRL